MNFSNPKPILSKDKKESVFKSIINGIDSLVSFILAGSMFLPDEIKNKISPQQFKKALYFLILFLIYIIGMGIFGTFYFTFKLLF